MSNAVFPVLAGLKFDSVKSPGFSTKIQRAVSGRELRAAFMAYPLWTFKLVYEVLRDDAENNELKTLVGFFTARQGSFDSFLYTDPSDNAVTAQGFGTGNGVATQFQLIRAYGSFIEPVMNLNGTPSIYINGVLKTAGTDYTISAGMVTFAAAPANAAALTWTGSYYYRCRFLHDSVDFSQFVSNLWELKKCEFVGSLGSKI